MATPHASKIAVCDKFDVVYGDFETYLEITFKMNLLPTIRNFQIGVIIEYRSSLIAAVEIRQKIVRRCSWCADTST